MEHDSKFKHVFPGCHAQKKRRVSTGRPWTAWRRGCAGRPTKPATSQIIWRLSRPPRRGSGRDSERERGANEREREGGERRERVRERRGRERESVCERTLLFLYAVKLQPHEGTEPH